MTQALITINASPGSNGDLPIDTLVTLGNVGNGGELTYAWSILEQPPGTTNNLSSPTAPGPTFTPTKEGSYLIQLIVNVGLPDEKRDTVIAAVLQLKTRTRIPAAGEEDELSSTQGWSLAANALLRLVDTLRAKPWLCVAELGFGATVGNVVAFSGVSTIKLGLPGQETVPIVTLSTGLTPAATAGDVGVIDSAVDGGALTSGKLAYVNVSGLIANVTVPALTALGTAIYVSDAGVLSITAGTNSRQVGRLVALTGTSGTVYLDGAAGAGASTPTLQTVMTGGTPDNDFTLVDALRLRSAAGLMLELNESLDDVTITGREVAIRAGRGGTSSLGLTTESQTGATQAGSIIALAGDAVDGDGGQGEITAGSATGTGNGGQVTISGGNCVDAGAQAGPVSMTAGTNSGTGERAISAITSRHLLINSDEVVSGPRTWRRGLRFVDPADDVEILSGDGDPDGFVSSLPGSLFLDHANAALYQNVGGTSWTRLSANVLWEWNGADTSQFLSKVDVGIGAGIAGLNLSVVAGGPNGSLLRMGSTEVVAGAVIFPIDFVFPHRYVIEITYYAFSFTDVTTQGQNLAGVTAVCDAACAHFISFSHLNTTVALPSMYMTDVAFSAGTPFGPSIAFNTQLTTQWSAGGNQTGLTVRYTVDAERPFVSATPKLTVHLQGSGADQVTPPTQPIANGSSRNVPAYPVAWNGIDLDTIGLFLGNAGATTSWTVDIESIRILRHPDDR